MVMTAELTDSIAQLKGSYAELLKCQLYGLYVPEKGESDVNKIQDIREISNNRGISASLNFCGLGNSNEL